MQLNILQSYNCVDYQLCVKMGEEGGGCKVYSILPGLRGKEGNIENRKRGIKRISRYEFFIPFQPEREFKVYKSCKCSQFICSRVH